MKLLRRLLPAFLLAAAALRAEPAPLDPSAPAWQTRLQALSAPATLRVAFTETRGTPLKKKAVVVKGVARLARDHGLSLDYARDDAPLLVLDDKGLLLRHSDGRDQAAPAEAEKGVRLLHALFTFDLAALGQDYEIYAEEKNGGAWTLDFIRRPGSDAYHQRLALAGEAARLTGIQLERDARRRIVIALDPPEIDPAFTPEELARYFR
jgi:hypothetical protein